MVCRDILALQFLTFLRRKEMNAQIQLRVDNITSFKISFFYSGSPQQMAIFDQKFDKEDMVIVQDPYMKVEYKECGTSTDKLSAKVEASSSEHEGPTRDLNENVMDPINRRIYKIPFEKQSLLKINSLII